MVTLCREENTIGDAALDAFLSSGCLALDRNGRAWLGWGGFTRTGGPQAGRISFYAPDFFLRDERPWRVYERSAHVDMDVLVGALDRFATPSSTPTWRSSSFEAFAASFDDIQRRIAAGSLVKAVPFIARRARVEFDASRRAAVLASALRRCRGASLQAYGVWNDEGGMVGTTPETLFEERAQRDALPYLATMALAGTRSLGAPSLLLDPKEMHEHQVVVDGIVERLSPLGQLRVGMTDELRLPTLVHLHTPIEAHPARRVGFDEWVAALHPTAAIGAWPKAAGWRWLQDQPNAEERGRYGAPLGVVPPNETVGTCLVAIRNVQWSGEEARILAGGGIVAGSQVEREWREFNAKADSIQGALGL